MNRVWLVMGVLLGVLCSQVAGAGTLTATIGGIPATVPVSPALPTPATVLSPTIALAHTGAAGAPDFTSVSVTTSYNSGELGFIGTSTPGWSCTGSVGVFTCNGPDIPVNQSVSFVPNFQVRGGSGTSSTQIVASPFATDGGSPVFVNDSVSFTITDRTDLGLSAPATASVPAGSATPVAISVIRNSADPSQPANLWQNLRVGLNFPTGLRYGGASAAGWSCAAASATPGGTFLCTRSSNATGTPPETINVQVFGATPASTQQFGAQLLHDSADLNSANNTAATAVTVGSLGADLSPSFQSPTSAANGSNFGVTLVVDNNGPGIATSVQADLTLDPALQVTTLAPACVAQGASTYRCTAASIPAAGMASFPLVVRHTQAVPAGNVVAGSVVVSGAESDPITNNNSNSFAVTLVESADLSVSLSDSPDPVEPAGTVVVEALVRNLGADTASLVNVQFAIPGNAGYLGTTTSSAAGTPMSCAGSAPTITCTLSALSAGQSATAAIRLTAPSSGTLVTNATVNASTADTASGNNSDSETTAVRSPSRLVVRKTASSSVVPVNSEFFYSIAVSNTGSTAASGLILQDTVPASLSILAIEGGSFNCAASGQAVDCRMSTLAAGSSSTVIVRVRAPGQPGQVTNSASVTSTQMPTVETSSVTVDFTAVATVADLSLRKLDTADPVAPGAAFGYDLIVENKGSSDAAGFSISDPLPAGVVLLSAGGAQWSCSGTQAVLCTFNGTLGAGATTSVRLSVRAPLQDTVLNNTATVTVLPGETSTADNVDSETTTVQGSGGPVGPADLALSGALASTTLLAGQEVAFNLVASNLDGAVSAQNVVLCGSVSGAAGRFQVLSLTAPGTTCSLTGNGSQLSCTIAALAGGQSLAFTGTARVSADAPVASGVGLDLQLGCGRTDPRPADNAVTLTATVIAPPENAPADVSVLLTESADPVALGDVLEFRIEVRNGGAGVATGIAVATSLGAGFRYDRFTGTGFSCTGAGASVSCQRAAALPAQTSAVVVLSATAVGVPGSFESTALVSTSSIDPVSTNNRSSITTSIGAAVDPESIEQSLAPAAAMDPIAADAAPVVADICADPPTELAAQCNALISAAARGNQQDVVEGLRALFPEEVAAQSVSLAQVASTQFSNVDARISELRGGARGFSASGLALALGRQTLPLGMLSGLLDDAEGDPEVGGSGDLISPWGGFINGTLSRGDQDTGDGSRRVVSDFHSYGLTAGVDYRRSARLVLGAAVGYADFKSDVTDGGALGTKGFTLTGYTSWYPRDLVYVDARLSYALLDLDMTRRIRFDSDGFAVDRTATGTTDSSQFSFATSSGYHISRGTWTITPNASLRYVRSQVDGFSERGAGANGAIFGDQDIDSLQASVGLQVTKVISLSNGVITPQFDIALSREMRDEDLVIEARLAGAAADQIFRVRAEEPDQSFGNVGLGFVYVGPNGRQAYLSYRELLGASGMDRGTLTIGGRFEF